MAKAITVPKLGLTMEKAVVSTWMKQEGDPVAKGEGICIIETDKVNFEIEAPQEGILAKVMVEEGRSLPVGEIIAVIAQAGEAFDILKVIQQVKEAMEMAQADQIPLPTRVTAAAEKERKEIKVSPLARRIAEEKGIRLEGLVGTGPGGSITKEDVLKAREKRGTAGGMPETPLAVSKKIPLKGIRKVIAERMTLSWHAAPRVTQVMEVDMTEALRFREENLAQWEEKGVKASINDILIRVVSLALRAFPEINASLKGEEIEVYETINMGLAVATERGLLVPVLRNADKKSLFEIANESDILIQKARQGKLGPDELSFGTFTLTNMGAYGIDHFTPIINPPESAILGLGKVDRKVKVIDEDKIAIRSVMNLCFVFDHRVIDGAPAARFMSKIKESLENPGAFKEWI